MDDRQDRRLSGIRQVDKIIVNVFPLYNLVTTFPIRLITFPFRHLGLSESSRFVFVIGLPECFRRHIAMSGKQWQTPPFELPFLLSSIIPKLHCRKAIKFFGRDVEVGIMQITLHLQADMPGCSMDDSGGGIFADESLESLTGASAGAPDVNITKL